jgi:hypothetical protein
MDAKQECRIYPENGDMEHTHIITRAFAVGEHIGIFSTVGGRTT